MTLHLEDFALGRNLERGTCRARRPGLSCWDCQQRILPDVQDVAHPPQPRLANHKSYAQFVWPEDPSRRLGVEVPFGTTLADVVREAVAAVRALSAELAAAEIEAPPAKI